MRNRRTSVIVRAGRVPAMIALLTASLAVTGGETPVSEPACEPIEISGWKKKIKRLKLADPESTEMMLA